LDLMVLEVFSNLNESMILSEKFQLLVIIIE